MGDNLTVPTIKQLRLTTLNYTAYISSKSGAKCLPKVVMSVNYQSILIGKQNICPSI